MARMATRDELAVYDGLQRQITARHRRNSVRTLYADAERLLDSYGVRLPDGKHISQTPMFWPAKAVDVFSSRLRPAGFTLDDAGLLSDLEAALDASEAGYIEQLAIKSALRHGCSFVFSGRGDTDLGEPEVVTTVSSALTATASVSRTGIVTAALELLDARKANLYLPGRTLHTERRRGRLVVHEEIDSSRRVLCAPYVHGATSERPFGSSRITRPIMGLTDAGVRTFIRAEVSAEWYSSPRERLLGVDASAFEDGAGWTRAPGGVDLLPDIHPDDDPHYPDTLRRATIQWSPQASMQPFGDQMRMIGQLFSGAASIPPTYIGIASDSNPASAQAIWAQEVDLVRAVEDEQPSLSRGRRALALNTLTVLHGDIDPRELATLKSQWQDPKTRSPLEQGQFVAQQVGAGNFRAGTRATLDLLPISPESARIHADENRRQSAAGLLDQVLSRPADEASAVAAESTDDMKGRFEALGLAIRAGVDPDDAAQRLGLAGIQFTGAVPMGLRVPERDSAALEGR